MLPLRSIFTLLFTSFAGYIVFLLCSGYDIQISDYQKYRQRYIDIHVFPEQNHQYTEDDKHTYLCYHEFLFGPCLGLGEEYQKIQENIVNYE